MRRMILVASTFLVAAFLTVSSAQAQSTEATASISPAASGHGRGIGVGALTMLNGTSGALATWGSPGGGFHVDGFFGTLVFFSFFLTKGIEDTRKAVYSFRPVHHEKDRSHHQTVQAR